MDNPFTDVRCFTDWDDTRYFSHPALSRSDLVQILLDPIRWKHGERKPKTKAMDRGTILHGLILQGDEWATENLHVLDDADFTKKDGSIPKNIKATTDYKKAAAEAGLRLPLLKSELATYDLAVQRARAAFGTHLEEMDKEVVFLATHEPTGLEVKAKVDLVDVEGLDAPWAADLKTSDDVSHDAFRRTIANYRLDIQAAFYGDLVAAYLGQDAGACAWDFLGLEPNGANLTAIYQIPEAWENLGRVGYTRALSRVAEVKDDSFPKQYIGELVATTWLIGGE